jgi:hypothetical protein
MADAAHRRATYQDVSDADPTKIAELLDGELTLSPRPATPHVSVSSALGTELGPALHPRARRPWRLAHRVRTRAAPER